MYCKVESNLEKCFQVYHINNSISLIFHHSHELNLLLGYKIFTYIHEMKIKLRCVLPFNLEKHSQYAIFFTAKMYYFSSEINDSSENHLT